MTHLSDKELLKRMKELPAHELNGMQRTRIIQSIREQKAPGRRFGFIFQQAGILAALLAVLTLVPVLFWENLNSDLEPHSSTGVDRAEAGKYFALMDDAGKPVFLDSNYGIPGKVSLLSPPEWVAEDYRSGAKIMVYLWGNPDKLVNHNMKIEAIHVDTGYKQELAAFTLSAGMYGSDAHTLTSFKPFEKHGVWNLRFMFGKETFDEFSIYVKEPYVEIGQATLMVSREDLAAGSFENVNLEVEGDNLPEKVELELFSFEEGTSEVFSFSDKQEYIKAGSGKTISMYSGDLVLKKSGKYRMTVLDKSANVNVRKPVDRLGSQMRRD
ncbi:hypothetical protein [Bacillus sp. J33]|uniref:hypothetical protein n=1 Tax=Bacillus sp. J33 TaxID=935836 RepID=UPI00047E5AB2|nr:hypothetical protein [Bacillus sp. J33]